MRSNKEEKQVLLLFITDSFPYNYLETVPNNDINVFSDMELKFCCRYVRIH